MPNWKFHLAVAEKCIDAAKIKYPYLYRFGALYPDMPWKDKVDTDEYLHYIGDTQVTNRIPRPDIFILENKDRLQDDFWKGILTHIVTDHVANVLHSIHCVQNSNGTYSFWLNGSIVMTYSSRDAAISAKSEFFIAFSQLFNVDWELIEPNKLHYPDMPMSLSDSQLRFAIEKIYRCVHDETVPMPDVTYVGFCAEVYNQAISMCKALFSLYL